MADEQRKILLSLSLDTVQAVKNQAQLKELLKASNVELSKASIGSAEYKKLETAQGLVQQRLKGLQAATKQSNSALNVQEGSLRDLTSQYSGLTRALREAKPGTDVLGLSFEDAKKKSFELKQEIKSFEEQLGNTAPNVGNYKQSILDAAKSSQVFGVSVGSMFDTLAKNPLVFVIGLFALLAKALMSNDTIATFFKGVMTGLGIVMDNISAVISEVVLALTNFGGESSETSKTIKDVLIRTLNALLAPFNYIIDLMPAVGKALKFDFAGAAKIADKATGDFTKSITFANDELPGFVKNIKDAANAGIAYEEALDAIEAKQSRLNVTLQALENQRDKLFLQSKDLARSEEDQIKLSEKAEAINRRILAERVKLLDEEIAAQTKYTNSLGRDSLKREEASFRLNDLQVKRLEFENEALKFEEKNQNKRNAVIEKQLADQARLTEAEKKAAEKRAEDARVLSVRIIDSENKLQQFRLDNAAKRAKDIDEKLKLELKAEDFRVKVLLSNEKLLASEKEFILADSAAKKLDLQIAADKASLDQTKKTEAERVAAIQKANDQVKDYANQTAAILQSINQTNLNEQLTDLENAKNAELRAAGNNAVKKAKIEADYNAKKEKLEKDAARRANDIAIIQALINTALSVTKALGSAPPPANFILAALNAAAGGAQVAAIISQNNKLEDGGLIMPKLAKGGIIGGKPHSQGGTVFTGTDGSSFEAEAGEMLAVVNKKDTGLLAALSSVNSIHGKAFYGKGGMRPASYLADGGFAARAISSPVESSINQRNQIMDIVSSLPNPIVFVEDMNTGQSNQVRVRSRADI